MLDSPALLRAVDLVAAGHRASGSSVLLAAVAAMTARLSGSSDAVLQVIVDNRFLPGLTHAVSVVAGDGLLHLPDVGGEFGALVRRTHAAAIATYRHAYFDKRLLDEEIARLTAEHGPLADRSCIVNDTRDLLPMTPAAPAGARPPARPSPRRSPGPPSTGPGSSSRAPGSPTPWTPSGPRTPCGWRSRPTARCCPGPGWSGSSTGSRT
ncbi:hypothetical protein ACFQ0M_10535 [Kitasatospora aburaviensis]